MGLNPRRIEKIEHVVSNRQLDLCVVLENVYDDHNIGAVLRSCDSVGIQELYILNTFADNKKKYIKVGKRTSAGTRKYLNVHYYNDPNACFKHVKERYKRILGTGLGKAACSLYELDLTSSAAFVFGNEKTGITPKTQEFIDFNFIIPQMGMAQSLNISVACAVSLYECYRQRQMKQCYNSILTPDKSDLLEFYLGRSKSKPDASTEYKIFSEDSTK
jgi:tRNA (guanosine-2'-O-)-methyltransferase